MEDTNVSEQVSFHTARLSPVYCTFGSTAILTLKFRIFCQLLILYERLMLYFGELPVSFRKMQEV